MENSGNALAVESWTLYAVGVCLIVARIACRLWTLGCPCRLQLDDCLMVLVLVPLTGTVVCANEAVAPGRLTSGGSDPVWKNKMRFALEELQVTANWLVKACLLILYRRIFPSSASNTERRYINWAVGFCMLSFLTIQISLPLWCYPTYNYWAASPLNAQCTTYRNHAILALTFSTATTLATMIIPVPMIPTPRRLLLALLLSIGTSTLVSGILARAYLVKSPTSPTFLHWLIAELVLMIIFANVPFLGSLYNTSTSSPRFRQFNDTLSLSQWPRSYKDTPPLRATRQRLNSATTSVSTLPNAQSSRLGSMASSVPPSDIEDGWSDTDAPSVPPTPVRKMTLTDPPPELEVYWSSRRSSARDLTAEKPELKEVKWPLK